MVMAPPTTTDSAVSPCFHGAWHSSTGISHPDLLPHIPSVRLSAVNSSPRPGIAPESPNSSSQLLCLLGDLCPCLECVWLWQGLSDSHSIYATTDQLFHSQPKIFLLWFRQLLPRGDQTPTSVLPPTLRAGPGLLRLLFSPHLLHPTECCGSIYSFPLVRDSCDFSDGVLQALLCLKVYSWCIRGEKCNPHPPTPLPSCSPVFSFFPLTFLISLAHKLARPRGLSACTSDLSPYLKKSRIYQVDEIRGRKSKHLSSQSRGDAEFCR